jgi:hypothetical protein
MERRWWEIGSNSFIWEGMAHQAYFCARATNFFWNFGELMAKGSNPAAWAFQMHQVQNIAREAKLGIAVGGND